ncbi:exosortase family protein XrtF [Weeksellaceae bacterium A-14]
MFKDFRPVLVILLRFLAIYLIPMIVYQLLYINHYQGLGLDPFSKWVGSQSCAVQTFLGYPSRMVDAPGYDTSWFLVSGKYPSRMVEGCNAVSVMLLFAAFVFAFYKGARTFLFAGLGIVLLHVMNVLRIAGLNILILEHPEYTKAGHDYFFPAIIYGTVVVLWIVWIKFFALKNENR